MFINHPDLLLLHDAVDFQIRWCNAAIQDMEFRKGGFNGVTLKVTRERMAHFVRLKRRLAKQILGLEKALGLGSQKR
jgi:hypothetical protein